MSESTIVSEETTASSTHHASAVANHYNQLEELGLQHRTLSRIFYLRNFNNWIKSVLIADTLSKIRKNEKRETSGISVLDLCSGKGGDLLKWKKGKIDYLVCADIAETSVKQSEERHIQNTNRERYKIYDAEFITADCTKCRLLDKFKSPLQKFDLTSCQFSFHYCFESYPQTMMMLRNACESLRPGGYFIGTTPNSHEIVRRLKQSDKNSFGNDVYKITFPNENKTNFPLFGAMYDFHLEGVVDCPEFLVYFPVLERLAAEFGMKLVKKENFVEFFKNNIVNNEHISLLSNMQALEPYPPNEDSQLSSSSVEDYEVARQFIEALNQDESEDSINNTNRKIGTLSKGEWEAATLYLVFVFQKIEDKCPPTEETENTVPASSGDAS